VIIVGGRKASGKGKVKIVIIVRIIVAIIIIAIIIIIIVVIIIASQKSQVIHSHGVIIRATRFVAISNYLIIVANYLV
jgi:lipopolysaccharide/colanic/teichoic acid biosynthesis glycosyltransferase